MYQALYRKWRPKVFADVIGQPHITETLRRQVAEGLTSHAYLFTGTRGTGKTTCAKILAKAVNCEHPVNGDPCGQCAACMDIENGGVDVLELDAASNSGVDQVRALRSEAIYSPANVKKRVYIIDEVHMLSEAAFNALLKIMEEPPEHLMFILATTEVHKILPTILSRCQRFSFRRIPSQLIAQRLQYVAEQEGINLRPEGAELLSRLAEGALRDALSLLDQCAASGGTIDADAVLGVLGLTGNVQTAHMMEMLLNRDARNALQQLDRLYNDGKDMGAVLSELAALTRDLLLRKTAPEGSAELLSGGYETALLDELGRGVSGTRFLYMASMLQKASADLHYSSNSRLDTELCLLRLCDESLSGDLTALTARVQRMEDMLAGASGPVSGTIPAQVPLRPEPRRPVTDRKPEPERTARPPEPERMARSPEPERTARSPEPERTAKPPQPARRNADLPPLEQLETSPEELPWWDTMEPPPEKKDHEVPFWEREGLAAAEAAKPAVHPETARPAAAKAAKPAVHTEAAKPAATEAMKPAVRAETAKPTAAKPAEPAVKEPPKPEAPAEPPQSAPPTEAVATVPAPSVVGAAIPAAADLSESAPAVIVGNWWPEAKEKCKGRLPAMYRAFLNICTGVLENGIVVLYAPDDITIGRLDNERVRTAVLEEAQAALGQAQITQMIFRNGNPPIGSPEENLNNLMKTFGGRYDNVKIT